MKKKGGRLYEKIASKGKEFLKRKGYILFEIGYDQKNSVSQILKENEYTKIKCISDLNGIDRVIIGKKE